MGGGFTTTGAGTGGGGKNEQLELWVSQHHTPSLLGRKLHSSYLERHIPASGLVACAPRLALTPAWTARQMPPKMVNTMPRGTSQLAPMVVCGCQLRSADSRLYCLQLRCCCCSWGEAAALLALQLAWMMLRGAQVPIWSAHRAYIGGTVEPEQQQQQMIW